MIVYAIDDLAGDSPTGEYFYRTKAQAMEAARCEATLGAACHVRRMRLVPITHQAVVDMLNHRDFATECELVAVARPRRRTKEEDC